MTIPSLRQRTGKALFALMAIALLPLSASGQQVSIRVEGDGALRLLKDGKNVYAKSATLTAVKGMLCAVSGEPIVPMVRIPVGATAISVGLDGTVDAVVSGKANSCGSLVLAMVAAPTDGRMIESAAKPALGNPGEGAFGVIRTSSKASSVAGPAQKSNEPTKSSGTIEVSFAPETVVTGTTVVLGEIATIISPTPEIRERLAAITLGSAPLYGTTRKLLPEYIRARVKQAAPDLTNVTFQIPAEVALTKPNTVVPLEKVIEEARVLAMKKMQITEGLENPVSVQPIKVPMSGWTVEYGDVNVGDTQVTVKALVKVDGQERTTRYIVFKFATVQAGAPIEIVWRTKGASVRQSGTNRTPNARVGQTDVVVETKGGERYTGTLKKGNVVEIIL